MNTTKRHCYRCHEWKSLKKDFYLVRRDGEKRHWRCKECMKADHRAYSKVNRKRLSASRAEWRAKNKDKDNATAARWRRRNPETHRERNAIYVNVKRRRKTHARWKLNNPEAKRAQQAVFVAIRRGDIIRPNRCERCRKRCKPDATHHDYSKPFDIEFLCRSCHVRKDGLVVHEVAV